MTKKQCTKQYDLEDRTFAFAEAIRVFTRKLGKDISTVEDVRQLIRSSGSVGANYIEANEAISKKDFLHRIRICRKEAKESRYWLKLLYLTDPAMGEIRDKLAKESLELTSIFGAILRNSQ